jgi:uncharacterized protein YndB with AHSA1/START domain
MARDLVFEETYPHPPAAVWRALTEREALAGWLMENDFEPRLGHRFRFRAQPVGGWDGIVESEVLELDPPRRLAISWRSNLLDTRVTFTLEPVAGGTRLRLVHAGFQGVKGMLLKLVLDGGWKGMVRKGIPEVVGRLVRGEPLTANDCDHAAVKGTKAG